LANGGTAAEPFGGCAQKEMHHVYPTVRLFVLVWLVVALLSAAYAAWDQFRGNPEPAVMK
jgi:hypothetical protein